MKKKFAEIYGVNLEQFKFIFDGSVLKDSETPEEMDMEDSNIIDVKVGTVILLYTYSYSDNIRWTRVCMRRLLQMQPRQNDKAGVGCKM